MIKKVMVRAHELAKGMEGDYAARLSLALRQAWAEAKGPQVAELQTLSGSRKHKTWVAKITGKHPQYKFNRTFVEAAYGNAMYKVFHLTDGFYDVCDGGVRKYIQVANGLITQVNESQISA